MKKISCNEIKLLLEDGLLWNYVIIFILVQIKAVLEDFL